MSRKKIDILFKWIFWGSSAISLFVLLGIILMLFIRGTRTFQTVTLREFFTTTEWIPSAYSDPQFGILALVVSSLMVAAGALVIAIPIGVGTAIYLAEFASSKVARTVKPAIEMLAGIPSVTIGFVGIVLLGPIIADLFNTTNGLNALNGSILLGIMALPTIISISEDAIYNVPKSYREASYALGVNRWDTVMKVILPAGSSGIIAAIMLGMGRVIGETMAVLMVAGNAVAMPGSFLDPIRPLTATIAIEMGEVPFGTTHYFALFELGVILFLIALAINLISDKLIKRLKVT